LTTMPIFRWLLLFILVAVTMLMAFLPYMPYYVAGQLWLISFIAWPLAVVDLVYALILLRKGRRAGYFLLLALLLCLPCLVRYVPFGIFSSDDKSSSDLRIISWNVSNYSLSEEILHNSTDFIRSKNADIVCLQERPHNNLLRIDSIRAAFADYPYMVVNIREDEVLNLAVISKYPIVKAYTQYFHNSFNKFLSVEIDVEGRHVRLYNVHLQTTNRMHDANGVAEGGSEYDILTKNAIERNRQAEILKGAKEADKRKIAIKRTDQKEKEKENFTIICGDFNDIRTSYAYRTLASGMDDACQCGGKRWLNGSFKPLGGVVKIDHILCSENIKVTSYESIDTEWSDHFMQYASFDMR